MTSRTMLVKKARQQKKNLSVNTNKALAMRRCTVLPRQLSRSVRDATDGRKSGSNDLPRCEAHTRTSLPLELQYSMHCAAAPAPLGQPTPIQNCAPFEVMHDCQSEPAGQFSSIFSFPC